MSLNSKLLNLFLSSAMLIFLCMILFAKPAMAADFSVGVSPSLLQIEAKTPDLIKKPIEIENTTDKPISLNIQFMPFSATDKQNNEISYSVDTKEFFKNDPEIFEKIKIYDADANAVVSHISLEARQKKTVYLSVDIPSEEKYSDYYFSIVFISKNIENIQEIDKNQFSAQTTINAGIAVNVLLSIPEPNKKPEAIIDTFSTSFSHQQGPVIFTLKIKNTKNNLTWFHGYFVVKNVFGQPVGNIEVKPTIVLANTTRSIDIIWPEKIILGPYTSFLTINLEKDGPSYGRTIHFLGTPIKFFTGVIVIIIILLIIISRIKSKME